MAVNSTLNSIQMQARVSSLILSHVQSAGLACALTHVFCRWRAQTSCRALRTAHPAGPIPPWPAHPALTQLAATDAATTHLHHHPTPLLTNEFIMTACAAGG